mmetsp:Transcript_47604/g.111073  ORF Transcript_47604/g.111073 Transcript_47604/m.111073 type:complete len:162 (-) Transcript_47604:183-668(-)
MFFASLVALDLAFLSQAFFFLALALLTLAMSSAPAFMAATTLIVSEQDQGKTQAAVSASFHGSSALSLMLYGALFKAQALLPGRVMALSYWVGTGFVALGLAYGVRTRTWHELSETSKMVSVAVKIEVDSSDSYASSELGGVQLRSAKRQRSGHAGHTELR